MSYFSLQFLPNAPTTVIDDVTGLDGTESIEIMGFDSTGQFLAACDATTQFGFGPVDACSKMMNGGPCCGESTYQLTIDAAAGISYVAIGWDDTMTGYFSGISVDPPDPPAVPEPRDTFALFALGAVLLWGAWMWGKNK